MEETAKKETGENNTPLGVTVASFSRSVGEKKPRKRVDGIDERWCPLERLIAGSSSIGYSEGALTLVEGTTVVKFSVEGLRALARMTCLLKYR